MSCTDRGGPLFNGRACPYYARYYDLPGRDPAGECNAGCSTEPACVTDEPSAGWPPLNSEPTPGGHDE